MAFANFSSIASCAFPEPGIEPSEKSSIACLQGCHRHEGLSAAPLDASQSPGNARRPPSVGRFREESDEDSATESDHDSDLEDDVRGCPGPSGSSGHGILHLDGTYDSKCTTCYNLSKYQNLHRQHGLPLDTISEQGSESNTRSRSTSVSSYNFAPVRCRSFLRRSSSAPEIGDSAMQANKFSLLFPSLYRHTSSHGGPALLSSSSCSAHGSLTPAPLSPLDRSRDVTEETDKRVKTPEPHETHVSLSTRSAPTTSPSKKLSQTLEDIARILRGQSPRKDVFNSEEAIRYQETAAIQKSSGSVDTSDSLSRNSGLESGDHSDDFAERVESPRSFVSVDLGMFPQPLTVRNRSSLDTFLSGASSCMASRRVASKATLSSPVSKQAFQSACNKSDDGAHDTARDIHMYTGSWPSLKPREGPQEHVTPNRVPFSLNSSWSSLFASQDLYENTPRSRTTLNNFQRFRFSTSSSSEDPFFDAPDYPPNLDSDGLAHENQTFIRAPSCIRTNKSPVSAFKLWPEPLRVAPTASASHQTSASRIRSISSMLRISNGLSRSASTEETSPGGSKRKICAHGKQIVSPTVFTGAKLKRPPSWFSSKRAQGCWKCELADFKDEVKHKAKSEGYRTHSARKSTNKRRLIKSDSNAVFRPPGREWLALPSEPNMSRQPAMPGYDGNSPLLDPEPPRRASFGQRLRSSCSKASRRLFIWTLTHCFCAEVGAAADNTKTVPAAADDRKTPRLKVARRRSEID